VLKAVQTPLVVTLPDGLDIGPQKRVTSLPHRIAGTGPNRRSASDNETG
jgi:hypothetical protein